MKERLKHAIAKAQEYLLSKQEKEGYFRSNFHMDLALEADTMFMLRFVGIRDDVLEGKLLNFILSKELNSGGWSIYPGGPAELNTTIKSYLALKLKGFGEEDPIMARSRRIILELGGIEKSNSYNRIYLAMFGLGEWEAAPAIPPELILFPDRFIFNIYDFSAWTRTIIVPLSIVWAVRPVRPLAEGLNVDELYKTRWRMRTCGISYEYRILSWKNFFLFFDAAVKFLYRFNIHPLKRLAMRKARRWMIERFGKSAGLGAIYPSIINSIFALSCLGYDKEHPLLASNVEEVKKLIIDYGDRAEVQPCLSPVWDTALSVYALGISGLPAAHPALIMAGRWLLDKQIMEDGDWKVKARDVDPGGWYFEFENEFYPDIDDTAQVLLALLEIDMGADESRKKNEFQRGLNWLLKMQSRDGGFSSFDKDNDKEFLNEVPFADHNAMLDPTCADITGRVCELLGRLGREELKGPFNHTVAYLKSRQLPDGTWYGRWGVNYIYGTFLASRGLAFSKINSARRQLKQAARWIRGVQNKDGGWGETPFTYDDPSCKGSGVSTPSQTAWALLALFANGDYDSNEAARGIEYLIRTQQTDGAWQDLCFTGTGFPGVCYLKYELYPVYFPLIALSEYARATDESKVFSREPSSGKEDERVPEDFIKEGSS